MNCAYRYQGLFLKAIIINPMPGLTDFTFRGNVKFTMLALNHSKKNIGKFLKEMVVIANSGHDIVTDNPEIMLETVKSHFQ